MTCQPFIRRDAGCSPAFELAHHNPADLIGGNIEHHHDIIQQMFAGIALFFAGRHFEMERIAGSQRLARLDIHLTAKPARQAIAEPEGEGVGFTIQVGLGLVQEREVHIVDFIAGNAVAGIQNTEGQPVVSGLIFTHFKRDFANLRRGHRVLNE